MAAVANATGLDAAAGRPRLPAVRRRRPGRRCCARGGRRRAGPRGQVEVVSSLERDGRAGVRRPALGRVRRASRGADDVRRRAASPSTACAPTRRAATPRCTSPFHLIGLELGSASRRRRCAASRPAHRASSAADVVAIAKRDLRGGRACSTAKAATRCAASSCRRRLAGGRRAPDRPRARRAAAPGGGGGRRRPVGRRRGGRDVAGGARPAGAGGEQGPPRNGATTSVRRESRGPGDGAVPVSASTHLGGRPRTADPRLPPAPGP